MTTYTRSALILFAILALGFTSIILDGNHAVSQAQTSSPPITIETADQLEQVAVLGQGLVYNAQWLADGNTLAVLSTTGVWLYAADTLDQPPRQLAPYTGLTVDKALSPDGTLLATSSWDGYPVRLWSVETGSMVSTLTGHTQAVQKVNFSPDGSLLASGDDDGVIRLWDVRTGTELAVLRGHSKRITELAFNPEGTLITSSSWDDSIRVWDVSSGQETLVLRGEERIDEATINGVAFGPDGTTLVSWSSGSNSALRVRDMQDGTEVWSLDGSFSRNSVAMSPSKHLLAILGEGGVRLLSAETGVDVSFLASNGSQLLPLAFSPDGNLFSALNENGDIVLWNVATAAQNGVWPGRYSAGVYSVAFNPESTYVAAGYESGTIGLWNLESREKQFTLRGDTSPVADVVFDSSGTLLASAPILQESFGGSPPGGVRLWDWKSQNQMAVIGDWVGSSVDLDPAGRLLAYISSENNVSGVSLWDVEQGENAGFLQYSDGITTCVAFNPTGMLLAAGKNDSTVLLWDVETKSPLLMFRNLDIDLEPSRSVTEVLFSPDGMLLAASYTSGAVHIWNVAQREQTAVLETGSSSPLIYGMAFSPNGQLLATPTSWEYPGGVQVWNVATGQQMTTLAGHNGPVYSVAFSPDGTLLASAGEDGTVRLWGIP